MLYYAIEINFVILKDILHSSLSLMFFLNFSYKIIFLQGLNLTFILAYFICIEPLFKKLK